MSIIFALVLTGEAKLYKHPKADTFYVAIPSRLVQDSTFAYKVGERVSIRYDPETKAIVITPLEEDKKRKSRPR
jgi:hypothetical protein